MPLTKKNRFITFLLSMAAAFLLAAAYVSTANEGVTTRRQDRIVDGCLLAAMIATGWARMEYLQRRTKHDLRSDINAVGLNAQQAARDAHDAAKEARSANETMPDRVVKKINGGLEREAKRIVDKTLAESPLPTTPEEWKQFVKSVQNADCEAMIDRALDRAVQRGWKPPEQS